MCQLFSHTSVSEAFWLNKNAWLLTQCRKSFTGHGWSVYGSALCAVLSLKCLCKGNLYFFSLSSSSYLWRLSMSITQAVHCETQQTTAHQRLAACCSMRQSLQLWSSLAYINRDVTSRMTQKKYTPSSNVYFETSNEGRSTVNNASAVFVKLHAAQNLPQGCQIHTGLSVLSLESAFLLEGHSFGIISLFSQQSAKNKKQWVSGKDRWICCKEWEFFFFFKGIVPRKISFLSQELRRCFSYACSCMFFYCIRWLAWKDNSKLARKVNLWSPVDCVNAFLLPSSPRCFMNKAE